MSRGMNIKSLTVAVSALVLSSSVNAATITVEGNRLYVSSNASKYLTSSGQISDIDLRSSTATIEKFDSSLGELTSAFLTYNIETWFSYDSRINANNYSTTQLYQQGSTVSGQHSFNYALNLDVAELESGSSSSVSSATSTIQTDTWRSCTNGWCSSYPVWFENSPANWVSEVDQREVVVNLLDYYDINDLVSINVSDVLNLQLDHTSHLITNCQLYSNSKDCWSSTQSSGTVISSVTYNYNEVSAVPLPAAVWLFGSGLIGLIGIARRKSHA